MLLLVLLWLQSRDCLQRTISTRIAITPNNRASSPGTSMPFQYFRKTHGALPFGPTSRSCAELQIWTTDDALASRGLLDDSEQISEIIIHLSIPSIFQVQVHRNAVCVQRHKNAKGTKLPKTNWGGDVVVVEGVNGVWLHIFKTTSILTQGVFTLVFPYVRSPEVTLGRVTFYGIEKRICSHARTVAPTMLSHRQSGGRLPTAGSVMSLTSMDVSMDHLSASINC